MNIRVHGFGLVIVPMALMGGLMPSAWAQKGTIPTPSHTSPSYTPPSHSSTPSYSPPPRSSSPSYTPPPRSSSPSYTPPARSGASPNSTGTVPPRTYTPGGTPRNSASSSSSTTFAPHARGTGSGEPSRAKASAEGVTNSNGTTVFTPHAKTATGTVVNERSAKTSSNEGVTGANGVTTFTPHASHETTFSPKAPIAAATAPANARASSTVAVKPSGASTYSVPIAEVVSSGHGASVLTASGSKTVIDQVNASRTHLTGLNHQSIPKGQVTTHANGSLTVETQDGRSFGLRPNGSLATYQRANTRASFRSDGHVNSVHTSSLDIKRGVHGERVVIDRRPDKTVVVRSGPRSGFVQRTVQNSKGISYVQRTYVSGASVSTRTFTNYTYHGRELANFDPSVTYAPEFYGWAYYPWDTPAAYAWPWASQPWYGFYGNYFSPASAYPSPAAWLTDYLMGQIMSSAYQEQEQDQSQGEEQAAVDDSVAPDAELADSEPVYATADTPITPELKQSIADEARQQVAYENAASQSPAEAPDLAGLPQVLVPNHIFVVDAMLDVLTADSNSCQLSRGDTLKLVAAPAPDSSSADLRVASSRRGDCPAAQTLTLSLEQLQEMQNSFRAQVNAGLQALHDGQGKDGLPASPKSAMTAPPRPADGLPAADDGNAAALLQSADSDAEREEAVVREAFTRGQ
jgi:hypothetical protein